LKYRNRQGTDIVKVIVLIVIFLTAALIPAGTSAAPTAEIAKRCMHYSYLIYPCKRPGSVRGSGDRQSYFRDCMAKNGDVPAPDSPKP
jgi:hypothetical protein